MITHNAEQFTGAPAGQPPAEGEDRPRPAAPARLDGVHVLVVDDERDAR